MHLMHQDPQIDRFAWQQGQIGSISGWWCINSSWARSSPAFQSPGHQGRHIRPGRSGLPALPARARSALACRRRSVWAGYEWRRERPRSVGRRPSARRRAAILLLSRQGEDEGVHEAW